MPKDRYKGSASPWEERKPDSHFLEISEDPYPDVWISYQYVAYSVAFYRESRILEPPDPRPIGCNYHDSIEP